MKNLLVLVQILNKGDNSTLIMQDLFNGRRYPFIEQMQCDFLIQKSHFTVACQHHVEIKLDTGENGLISFKGRDGSCCVTFTDLFQWFFGQTTFKTNTVGFSIPINNNFVPYRMSALN